MYKYALDEGTNQPRTDQILFTDRDGVTWTVPNDINNTMWKDYQAWLAQGNTPEAAS